MRKYLVKTIVAPDVTTLDTMFEEYLNEHSETHELWEYELVTERAVNVVMRAIEMREETPYERYQREQWTPRCPDCGDPIENDKHNGLSCDARTRLGAH